MMIRRLYYPRRLTWITVLSWCLSLIFPASGRTEDPWVGYAAGGSTGKVFIFSLPSVKLLKEVPIGVDIHGPRFSGSNKGGSNGTPDGKVLFLVDKALDNLLTLDLASSSSGKPIPLPKGFGPNDLDITPDGKTLCISGELSGQVAKVDAATGKVEALRVDVRPSAPDTVAITKDGRFCLVTDYINSTVLIYSLSPFKLERKVAVGLNPHGIIVTPDNKYALISNKFSASLSFLNLESFKVDKTLKTGAVPFHTMVDSKGQFAYQSQFVGSVVMKIDLSKKEIVDRFPTRFRPGHLAITPDDKYLLILNKYSTGLFEDWKNYVAPKVGAVIPNNFQVLDIDSGSSTYGKTATQAPVSGEPYAALVIARSLVKDAGLKEGKDFIGKGGTVSTPPKKGARVRYAPAKPHKPGVFDAPDGTIEVYIDAFSHQFAPNVVNVLQGDKVRFIITNIDEEAELIHHPDVVHGFTINGYGEQTNVVVPKGVSAIAEFTVDKIGEFNFYCSYFCGFAHMEMRGKLIVE